jgi:ABC-type glutathione transport system ATPase component
LLVTRTISGATNPSFSYDVRGGIPHEAFYRCECLSFLTEIQTNNLLHKFEARKDPSRGFGGVEEPADSERNSVSSGGRNGTFSRNQSVFFGARKKYARKVSRQEFITMYPVLLLEVTSDDKKDNVVKEGVDIAFENLCLTVKKGDKDVKVVNDVTGRLRAGTMTALMGGSGAGEVNRSFVWPVTFLPH